MADVVRADLVDLLTAAAEVEHAILVQYLFTASTLKRGPEEGIPASSELLVRQWQNTMLGVAHEEMVHLATVNHLLAALGAAPVLDRPNFPQPLSEASPLPLALTRWDDHTLWRYVRMELPVGEPVPPEPQDASVAAEVMLLTAAPQPIEYDYLGELYGEIRSLFASLSDGALLVPPGVDEDTSWGLRVRDVPAIRDIPTALSAVDAVVEQGEGSPQNRADSHYETFRRLRLELSGAEFDPARPVVANPRTWRVHRDTPVPGTYIENELTRTVAALGNRLYRILLLLLLDLFSYDKPEDASFPYLRRRETVRAASRHLMTSGFRPLSDVLTRMPVQDDPADGTAAIPFEMYSPIRVPARHQIRLVFVAEELEGLASDLEKVAREAGVGRLLAIATNARWIRANLLEDAQ